jgi:hypothetical protein
MESILKYYRSYLIILIILFSSYSVTNAQTIQLTIANAHASGTNFLFDIYLQATSGTVYLAGANLVLTFNSGNFTSPTLSKGLASTFILNNTNGDNTTSVGGTVGALYRSYVTPVTRITSNEIILNVGYGTISDQDQFNSDVALIDNNPYKFGTYTISGITNTGGTMGLA